MLLVVFLPGAKVAIFAVGLGKDYGGEGCEVQDMRFYQPKIHTQALKFSSTSS